MPFADIGVNLGDRRFSDDREAVLARAREADVQLMVLTGTDLQSSELAAELAAAEPGCYATAGVHPHHASHWNSNICNSLRALASETQRESAGAARRESESKSKSKSNNGNTDSQNTNNQDTNNQNRNTIRCIGETGLDFNRDFSPRPAQERAFAEQLQLAVELQLPVFLHQRDAHPRFVAILREYRDKLPQAVVHCFTDTRDALYDYLDLGCFIGITGWVCDERRGGELQRLVPDIPAQQLLLETDAPYLLPRDLPQKPPLKGRNEPALLPWIARRVAELRSEPLDQLQAGCWDNTLAWLGLEQQDT